MTDDGLFPASAAPWLGHADSFYRWEIELRPETLEELENEARFIDRLKELDEDR